MQLMTPAAKPHGDLPFRAILSEPHRTDKEMGHTGTREHSPYAHHTRVWANTQANGILSEPFQMLSLGGGGVFISSKNPAPPLHVETLQSPSQQNGRPLLITLDAHCTCQPLHMHMPHILRSKDGARSVIL